MNYLWVSILKVRYPDTSCIRAVLRDNYGFIRFSVDYSSGFYIISSKYTTKQDEIWYENK